MSHFLCKTEVNIKYFAEIIFNEHPPGVYLPVMLLFAHGTLHKLGMMESLWYSWGLLVEENILCKKRSKNVKNSNNIQWTGR